MLRFALDFHQTIRYDTPTCSQKLTSSQLVYYTESNRILTNKKLSCRRETAQRFVSLNFLLSHPRSLKVIQNDTVEQGVCKSMYCEIFSAKNGVTLKPGQRSFRRRLVDHKRFSIGPSLYIWLYLVLFRSYLTLNNRDLEIQVIGHCSEGHSNWYHSKAWVQLPIRHRVVSLTVYEIFNVKV